MTKRLALLILALVCHSAFAHADVRRFAVIIGSNVGDSNDARLRYAESDAQRMYGVLRDIGGFLPGNMVLLQAEPAQSVEDTLILVNDRVRSAVATPGTQVLLFVYYSGHADAEALHLGSSRLAVEKLSQLVRGSAASFRLLVMDACRSGAVTRRKGGRVIPAPMAAHEDTLPESGLAFVAASAAHEDAQESDEIGGSFFTHALVSGLLGAADADGDGAISLGEAYQYAYDSTLRATSRSLYGTQHPTFRFDLAGQSSVVLTRPEAFAATRATFQFPPGIGFLLLRDGAEGAVVAEVGAADTRRSLSVRPGKYFVRGRGKDVLFEGRFSAAAGSVTTVDPGSMDRIQYAALVRKGGRSSGVAHGPEAGARVRTAMSNSDTACLGGFVGYGAELEHFGVRSRLGFCTSSSESRYVKATTNEYALDTRLTRSWDGSLATVELGLGGGAALFTQRFETEGEAPPRDSLSAYAFAVGGLGRDVGGGFTLAVDAAIETHFLRVERKSGDDPLGEVAVRAGVGVRKAF